MRPPWFLWLLSLGVAGLVGASLSPVREVWEFGLRGLLACALWAWVWICVMGTWFLYEKLVDLRAGRVQSRFERLLADARSAEAAKRAARDRT